MVRIECSRSPEYARWHVFTINESSTIQTLANNCALSTPSASISIRMYCTPPKILNLSRTSGSLPVGLIGKSQRICLVDPDLLGDLDSPR